GGISTSWRSPSSGPTKPSPAASGSISRSWRTGSASTPGRWVGSKRKQPERSTRPPEPGAPIPENGSSEMSARQWYMAIGGHQVGPVAEDEILANLRNGNIDADTLVFTTGMTAWQKVRDVPAFASSAGQAAAAPAAPPPVPPGRRAHDIDFVIHGNEMQYV